VRLKSEVNWLNDIITKNITELQEKVSKQNLDITTNKDSISTQSQDIADNKKSIDLATDNLSMKVNLLDSKTDTLSQKITNTTNALGAEINKNSAETQTLKTNVAANEAHITKNENSISTIGVDVKNLKLAPLGTITAWVNRPAINAPHTENLPYGWMRCDGSIIPSPSPWAGQHIPNINGEKRFLRGSVDSEMLQTEEDSIQSHTHGVSDPGHSHGYDDKWPSCGSSVDGIIGPDGCDTAGDRFDNSHPSTSKAGHTGISVTGAQGARIDSETRPKNIKVVYIMRVF